MTDLELGWTAGIIDGESCISLHKSYRNVRRGTGISPVYALSVQVACTDLRMLSKLRRLWGGSLHPKGTRQKEYHSQAWYWTLTGKNASALLESVKDHLVTKQEQAEVALEYQGGYQYAGKQTPVEEIARRDDIRRRLTLLKGRGVAV